MAAARLNSAAFEGTVVHRRLRPVRHFLRYRVFSLLIDLDELPTLDRRLRLFGHNRWNLFSFLERDHGGSEGSLKEWVARQLAAAGVEFAGGRVELLCYPRIFGYVFNPLSVYFCRRPDGTVAAILYQVNNTFGERHTYVLPVATQEEASILQSCPKVLHVSPFNDVAGRYDFTIRSPNGEGVSIGIDYSDAEGPILYAGFSGRRRELSDRTLSRMLLRYPLMTLKVIAGIHWEALRLMAKGVPLRRHQPPASPLPPEATKNPHVA